MYKVLLPTEGSEGSIRATKEALWMAKNYDAEVIALFIIPVFPFDLKKHPNPTRMVYVGIEEVARKVLEQTQQMFAEEGLELKTLVRRGSNVAQTILEEAEKEGCDLIIMGKIGIGEENEPQLGKISYKVIQHANVNVQLV